MTEPSEIVDVYLASRFKIGLEQLVLDASGGRIPPILRDVVEVELQQVDHRRYPDGGSTEGYIGTLTLEGVAYAIRCWVCTDLDGCRFLGDLSEFRPVAWQTTFKVAGRR
jgi:hypothetical protein